MKHFTIVKEIFQFINFLGEVSYSIALRDSVQGSLKKLYHLFVPRMCIIRNITEQNLRYVMTNLLHVVQGLSVTKFHLKRSSTQNRRKKLIFAF